MGSVESARSESACWVMFNQYTKPTNAIPPDNRTNKEIKELRKNNRSSSVYFVCAIKFPYRGVLVVTHAADKLFNNEITCQVIPVWPAITDP